MIFIINLAVIIAIALFDFSYLYSFIGASITSFLVMYSSYINILRKAYLSMYSFDDKDSSYKFLSSKEKFFLGLNVSFNLLRLVFYGITALVIIILIKNNIFYVWSFFAGVFMSCLNIIIFVRANIKN